MLTAENRKQRLLGIGGSDIGTIFGVNPWKTALQTYQEKLNANEDDATQNLENDRSVALATGHYLEPLIAKTFEARTNKTITIDTNTYTHPVYNWLIGHIDGRVENENAILECKITRTLSLDQWGEQYTDNVPDAYLLQCAHYAMVLNVDVVYLAALFVSLGTFKIYKYQRNDSLEKLIQEQAGKFWHEHVLKKIPPPPQSAAECYKLYTQAIKEKSVMASYHAQDAVENMRQLQKQAKAIETSIELQKKIILSEIQDAEILLNDEGKPIATWKNQISKRLDLDKLKKEQPNIYTQYLKESESRVLRLKDIKD